MTRPELHCYDYVNHPYEAVRSALLADPHAVLARAAALHAKLGPVDIGADVAIEVRDIIETRAHDRAMTQIDFTWRAAKHPGLFPTMTAKLRCYGLSPTETQVEITGTYEPPLGVAGKAVDALAMHKLAEESIANFVRDVANYLRGAISERGTAVVPG